MKKQVEQRNLQKFACDSNYTRGRIYPDEGLQFNRTEYQRDRDRILHSEAFRRLKQKTQVFVNQNSDHFRTRLTHTLEVAQLARSISRYLHLNDDLSEAIALAHDLGHPPYGHAGEDALAGIMEGSGGFDHNEQSIRIVTNLEKNYFKFRGLNLTFETLEGIMKHNGPYSKASEIPFSIRILDKQHHFKLNKYPSAEAQVANICDDIAYVSHDLNDGLNSGLIQIEDLKNLPIINTLIKKHDNEILRNNKKILTHQITKNLINILVNNLVKTSSKILKMHKFKNSIEIQNFNDLVIKMENEMYKNLLLIKKFLLEKIYKNKQILNELKGVNYKIKNMFNFLHENPNQLPISWQFSEDISILELGKSKRKRVVCDYISGMTDTYFNLKIKEFNLE